MKKGVIAGLIVLLLLSLSGYIFYNQSESDEQTLVRETFIEGESEESAIPLNLVANKVDLQKKESITITTATIAGVGDILIHRSLFNDAYTGSEYDFKPMFEDVKPYLSHADITFANQETMLGGTELGLTGYPTFNSPYEVGDALKDAGIDIVSLANNHTLDRGEQAILNATEYLNSIGIKYTGAYRSEEDKMEIRKMEVNEIVFSFLAYSYGTNGIPVPKGKEFLINLIDVEKIKSDIVDAKAISDVVVLSLHFGNEYEPLPNDVQISLANEFANTGADIIFGHHPHVLQPMEWIEREDGRRTFVAYSLGNFISGQEGIEREIGGIAQLEVKKTVQGNKSMIELKDPRFLPVFTYKRNWKNFHIYILDEIGDDVLLNADKHYEKTVNHVSQWMPELKFSIDID